MAIKITCPHCKRGMIVPEQLAGKKGRCKACKQILTVPSLSATGSTQAEAPPKDSPPPQPSTTDVEAEAAALFADEPKQVEEPVETGTVDLNCPYCDEAIQFSADLAGKRAPCPECKRVIKVPDLVKKDPKDWRKVEARGPSGARLPDAPGLEGAWGSARAAAVGKQSLVEAGVIPETLPPRTLWQKIRWPVLGLTALVLVGLSGWMGYRWWSRRAVGRMLDEVLAYSASTETKPFDRAALSLETGRYYLNPKAESPAKNANDHFGKAFVALRAASKSEERDALLTELALAEVEMGGTKEEADRELAVTWDKTQSLIEAAVREIGDDEARMQALRALSRRLLTRGQSERILPMVHRLYAANDADKAAALAVVAFEFLKAKEQPKAEKAAAESMAIYEGKTPPHLRAEVVALAETLQMKKAPKGGDADEDKANAHVGKVEGLARRGEWAPARKSAEDNTFGETVRFRAQLGLAAAAVDAQIPDTVDLETAMKSAEAGLAAKPELSWQMYRLIQLGLRTNAPQERIQALADKIGNTALRGRAQLAVFRARIENAQQRIEESAADAIDEKSLSRSLAALEAARINTRLGTDYAAVVQNWPQPRKAFGELGVLRGLQDREK
jgi:hypothetical protein